YECCKLSEEKAISPLEQKYQNTSNTKGKLLIAKALAWFSSSLGNKLIEDELKQMFQAELKDGYPEGYLELYDSIREKEKNVLDGLFWRINQNIALLGMSGSNSFTETIRLILE